MNRSKILIILGAGGSRPYMFPTASELAEMIIGRTMPMAFSDPSFVSVPGYYSFAAFVEKTIERYFPQSDILEFKEAFFSSQVYSIDRFVFFRPKYEAIAKHFIALILLHCERRSHLNGDWYQKFWNETVLKAESDTSRKIEIISFNYDRSLEHYLKRAAKACSDNWEDFFQRVKITNVYGNLGPLEGASCVEYGNVGLLERAATSIHLIPPRAKTSEEIQHSVSLSKSITFLGFGFDELNLKVLGINRDNRPNDILATRRGLSAINLNNAVEFMGREIQWASPDADIASFLHNSPALF